MNYFCRIFVLLGIIGLTGCTHMNSHLDCGLQKGATCKSLDEVNQLVDAGHLGNGKIKRVKRHGRHIHVAGNTPKPVRVPEEVMRIWVAPYQDAQGNYHGEKFVYAVVKSSAWLGLERES